MDSNIKTAASLLRNASGNLQNHIRELHADETNIHHHESQTEKNFRSDLLRTELRLADSNGDTSSTTYLVRRVFDLRKRRNQAKEAAARKISDEEMEIHSLQQQINKLNDLAHMLEMWR
ncbi:MAG: hypothetical protein ABIR37_04455 [Candidatus Saccharimonadales bacterium]